MVGIGDVGGWYVGEESFFGLEGVFATGSEADTFADSEYVSVDCHGGFLPDDG